METHADLIEQLGGGTALAAALWGEEVTGRSRQRREETVYKWKRNGIPWRWRPLVERMARERGIDLPPDFLLSSHSPPMPSAPEQRTA